MTVTARALYEAAQIPTAATGLYTVPAGTRTIIDKMTATNTTGANATITAYIVPATGNSGASNRLISVQGVAAGAAYLCPEMVGHILAAGDSIVTESSAAAITVRISGREIV